MRNHAAIIEPRKLGALLNALGGYTGHMSAIGCQLAKPRAAAGLRSFQTTECINPSGRVPSIWLEKPLVSVLPEVLMIADIFGHYVDRGVPAAHLHLEQIGILSAYFDHKSGAQRTAQNQLDLKDAPPQSTQLHSSAGS